VKRLTMLIASAAFLAAAAAGASAAPNVSVTGAWSRPAVDTAVVYGVVHNQGAGPLVVVGVSSPVARNAELHESMTMGAGKMDGAAMSAMGMQPVGRLVIRPHGTLTLKPGGYHVMLLGLRDPLAAGRRFPVTLRFAGGESATFSVPVEVRAF
jgi:periplasmic copper chaperone A